MSDLKPPQHIKPIGVGDANFNLLSLSTSRLTRPIFRVVARIDIVDTQNFVFIYSSMHGLGLWFPVHANPRIRKSLPKTA